MNSQSTHRKGLDRWLKRLSDLVIYFSAAAMVVLVLIFGWLVFGRYVLNATPTWVEQLSLLLVVYIVFLCTAAGVFEGTHLGVTMFRDALPRVPRMIASIIGDAAMAGFGLLMMLSCIQLFEFGWTTKLPMLDIPESFRSLPAVICGFLMFLFAGARVVARSIRLYRREPDLEPDLEKAS